MKLLLLDIDGVLNSHNQHPNGYCGIDHDKAARLHWIVQRSGCGILIVSAWRYLVLNRSMRLPGFCNLLLTHGVSKQVTEVIVGVLPEDLSCNDLHDRGKNCRGWWDTHPHYTHVVALDDGSWPDGFDLGYEVMGIPVVRPSPQVGLTDEEADRVVRLFNGEAK